MGIYDLKAPDADFRTLSRWGLQHLQRVVAIDSQSNEKSLTIPSTEGQKELSQDLESFFSSFGYEVHRDQCANLVVRIPATVDDAPKLALMVHIDTAEGTQALQTLSRTVAWTGAPISYPANSRLNVSASAYPSTQNFLGEDLIHGPGDAPFGLDDKLGMAHLMSLARILSEPGYRHGEVLLVFRPDEEIGRMEALESLAHELAASGVRHGYTIDGIAPFEVNVENFNAAGARVTTPATSIDVGTHRAVIRIHGVKSHGATAKAEGYLNALTVAARCLNEWPDSVTPIYFMTDSLSETSARLKLASNRLSDISVAIKVLKDMLEPHKVRGAYLDVESQYVDDSPASDSVVRALNFVSCFIASEGPFPRLSEDSEGWEGYSNPYSLTMVPSGGSILRFRLRDFDAGALEARCAHVARIASSLGLAEQLVIESQYTNMGPQLAKFPELVQWAVEALKPLNIEPAVDPIRGGTGVDPFLARGIGIANLGTGYFAPESEKEFTSEQSLARHAEWLTYLVQVVGAHSA